MIPKLTKLADTAAVKYLQIALGAAVYAVGIEWLFVPVDMVSGGVTGVAMIVNLLTGLPVGTLILLMNIPLFIAALRVFGLRFMLGSIIGTLASSFSLDLLAALPRPEITADPFLAAVFGGIITGIGMGLIFSSDSTSGGVDLIAALIRRKKPYIHLASFILLLDGLIILAYALIFRRLEMALYTVICVFISSQVIDMVLYGVSRSKLCFIISERSDEIKTEISETLGRGVTLLRGAGSYSGREKQILLCVVKHRQIVQIRRLIRDIDAQAFVIVTDARDVFGNGFGKLVSDTAILD